MRMVRTGWMVALTLTLVAAAAMAQQQSSTRREPQFENAEAKVWKSVIAPRQPLTMHRHEKPRVLVALKGGQIRIVNQRDESRLVTWESGHAYWLPADPPGERHADVNEGSEAIEVMVIELKR